MKTKTLLAIGLALSTAACSRTGNGDVNSASGMQGNQTIELIGGGFTTGSQGLHHANIIEFGAPQASVISQLSGILGRPVIGRNADCPTGEVDTADFGSLTLNFENGRFTGWVLDGPRPALETYHGLAIGMQRSALVDELAAEVDAESTLGTEVSVNEVGVLLSGPGANARVTNLFAGTTCFAR